MFGHPTVCLDAAICLDTPCMFLHPYVWMSPFIWMHPLYVWMPPYVWITPCMFGCPPSLDTLLYVWMPPYVWILPVSLGTLMFGCPLNMCGHSHMFGHPHMFGCLLYIYNTNKTCFGRLRGCPYTSIHLDAPICLDTCNMFGCSQNMWTLCMFGCPICLDTPLYVGHPYVWMPPEYVWSLPYVWMPPYVWKMFGYLLYIYNTKKACFVRLRGCPYAPIHLDAPICLDAPYVWTPLICLDVPHTFGCHHTFGSIQTYSGAAKHMENIQTYGGI